LRSNETACRDGNHLMAYQSGREPGEPIVFAVGPAILDGDVLAFNET